MKIAIRKIGDLAIPDSEADKEKWDKLSDAIYEIDIKNLDMRTVQQNRALHKLFSLTSEELQNAGETVNSVINRRKYKAIKDTFLWGKDRVEILKTYPVVYDPIMKILDKMETRLLKKEKMEIDWSGDMVKEVIWRKIQIKQTGKMSTTKLTKKEIDKVYDSYNLFLAETYGIHIPFPNKKLWEEEKDNQ